MTSQEWATCVDPAAMWAVVRDRATERQCQFFVEACRAEGERIDPGHWTWNHVPPMVWKDIAADWAGLPSDPVGACKVPLTYRADLLREVFGDPFKKMLEGLPWVEGVVAGDTSDCIFIDPAWFTWNDGTVAKLAAAVAGVVSQKCRHCFGDPDSVVYCKYCRGTSQSTDDICQLCSYGLGEAVLAERTRCEECVNGYIAEQGDWDLSKIPILADALEEAGCRDETLLRHLRGEEVCPWCHKGWVRNNETGMAMCDHCNGTGISRVEHHPGCHVVDMLLPEEMKR